MKIVTLMFSVLFLLGGCKDDASQKTQNLESKKDTLIIGTSPDYPPFEYEENNTLVGFDIAFAKKLSDHGLPYTVTFKSLPFQSLFKALDSGEVDAVISTLTPTTERKKRFDFSIPYFYQNIAILYQGEQPLTHPNDLSDKKVGVQLGSMFQQWVELNAPKACITFIDHVNRGIESLKAGHIDVLILDDVQAHVFLKNNPSLKYQSFGDSPDGFAVAFKKNSPLKPEFDAAITQLKKHNHGKTFSALIDEQITQKRKGS